MFLCLIRMYLFAGAALTQFHRLGGLQNRNLFSHSSRCSKSNPEASSCLISSETSPWLEKGHLLVVSSIRHPSLGLCVFWVLISFSYKSTSHMGLGPCIRHHFTLITSLMALSANTVTLWDPGPRKDFNKWILWRHSSAQSNMQMPQGRTYTALKQVEYIFLLFSTRGFLGKEVK